MPSIKTWLVVVRLPSVILALTSVMLGTMLAIWEGKWNVWVALLAALTGSLLQILANLGNDYGDWLHGANVGGRVGDPNQHGLVNLKQLKQAILFTCLITLVGGLWLLKLANLDVRTFIGFVLIGVMAIIAAISYTMGTRPYGYRGWGDLSVLIFFGFVGVLGTAYLHTKTWHWAYTLPAFSCGCFAVAVLNVNNIRDIQLDAAVGKKTWVVRIGRKAACYYQWALLSLGSLLLIIFTLSHYQRPWQWLFLVLMPRILQNGFMTMRLAPNQLDRVLQRLVMAQFFLLLLFGLGLAMSNR